MFARMRTWGDGYIGRQLITAYITYLTGKTNGLWTLLLWDAVGQITEPAVTTYNNDFSQSLEQQTSRSGTEN